MTAYIPPMPSGVVRVRRAGLTFAGASGSVRFLAEGVAAAWGAIAGAGDAVTGELERHRERRRMMSELAGLSDHALKDIGLNRSGLCAAVLDVEQGVDPRGR